MPGKCAAYAGKREVVYNLPLENECVGKRERTGKCQHIKVVDSIDEQHH